MGWIELHIPELDSRAHQCPCILGFAPRTQHHPLCTAIGSHRPSTTHLCTRIRLLGPSTTPCAPRLGLTGPALLPPSLSHQDQALRAWHRTCALGSGSGGPALPLALHPGIRRPIQCAGCRTPHRSRNLVVGKWYYCSHATKFPDAQGAPGVG